MLNSWAAWAAMQRARPLWSPAPASLPGTGAFLEGARQRNAFLDGLFYDTGTITQPEAERLSPWLAAEGAVLFVPPSCAGEVEVCGSPEQFSARHAADVHAVSVAGVGSSALGAAAFARNVADALGEPVAAVVSGYGLADLAAEAMGGFFFFGAANALRHRFEWLDLPPAASRAEGTSASPAAGAMRSRDTLAVQALLQDRQLNVRLLVGHSKGNLVISEALFALKREQPRRLAELAPMLRLVTVSAKIAMPAEFVDIVDVMGQLDGFGALNSRLDLKTEVVVPGAWHHTNTELPMHLPVTATLRALRAEAQAPALRATAHT